MIIDTHILVWAFEGFSNRLGPRTRELISGDFGNCLISMASFFEIKIKQRKGGLKQFSIDSLEQGARQQGATILDIKLQHVIGIPDLAITPHADPFDLMLMAQAISEGLPLLTCDTEILKVSQPGLRLVDGRV